MGCGVMEDGIQPVETEGLQCGAGNAAVRGKFLVACGPARSFAMTVAADMRRRILLGPPPHVGGDAATGSWDVLLVGHDWLW